jgi:hypothetical protein
MINLFDTKASFHRAIPSTHKVHFFSENSARFIVLDLANVSGSDIGNVKPISSRRSWKTPERYYLNQVLLPPNNIHIPCKWYEK